MLQNAMVCIETCIMIIEKSLESNLFSLENETDPLVALTVVGRGEAAALRHCSTNSL